MSHIKGRKLAQKELMFTQFVVDHAVDGITWIGSDARFRYVNNAFCRSLGYSRDELLSMTVHDIDPHFQKERWTTHWEELKRLGRDVIETVHRTKDGREIPVEIAINHQAFGGEEYHCAFIRNITKRKKAEERLMNARIVAEDEKAKTASIIAAIGDGISIQNKDFRIIYQNPVSKNRSGDHEGEFCYKAYLHKDSVCKECQLAMTFEDGGIHEKEQCRVTDEGIKCYHIISSPLRNSTGDIVAGIEAARDITERKKLEGLLALGKKEWEETFDLINDAITIHDEDFTIIRANKAAEQMLGLSFREIIGRKCHQLYHGTDAPPEGCASCSALKTGKPSATEMFEPHLDKYLEIKAIPQVDENNRIFKLVHVVRDITDRKRMEKELHTLSLTDELTGFTNRRGFFPLAEQQLKLSNRLKRGLFMLYIDVDNLKRINDTFGHKEGDLVLVEAGDILKECFREADVIARIGGDEFVVILVGSADYIIEDITARLQNNLQNHNQSKNRSYELSLSVGVAYYDPECPCSLDELLSHGDKMMYEQKRLKQKS